MKSAQQLEQIFKILANNYRLQIIRYLFKEKNASTKEISLALKRNYHAIYRDLNILIDYRIVNKISINNKNVFVLSTFGKKIYEIIQKI